MDEEVKSKPSIQSFNKSLFDFKRSLGYPLFGICNKFGIRLFTKIRVEFSDLRDHRFNHAFNCESPMCACGIETETSVHFFLRCPRYPMQRAILLSKISDIIHVSVFPDEHLFHILIYGSNVYNSLCNKLILIELLPTYVTQDVSLNWKPLGELFFIHFLPIPVCCLFVLFL